MKQARQGDIFFESVNKLPKGLRKSSDRVIAYGEVTGHSHQLESLDNADILVDEQGDMYLEVRESTNLVHDEHGTISFPPGIFKVTRQREYDAQEAARERRVAD